MEWRKMDLRRKMEWGKRPLEEPSGGGGGGGMLVKVMTDEQIEVLRKQIAVYVTISEQLNESVTDHAAGVRLGNPLITYGAHKSMGRQRWTPTPNQLQILERMFDQGIRTPSKQKIKEITFDLIQHGQISEMNIYNWFQNRRARSKRKQQATPANNGESEVETPNEKKTKPSEEFRPQQIDLCFQNSSNLHPGSSKPEPMLPPEGEGTSKFPTNFGHIPFYEKWNMYPIQECSSSQEI